MPTAAFAVIRHLLGVIRDRLAEARHDEAGYTTETILVTALLAALALTAVGIIVAKVVAKANSITTGP